MIKDSHRCRQVWAPWALLAMIAGLLVLGCGSKASLPEIDPANANPLSGPNAVGEQPSGRIITIGDLAKDSPSRIFKEYTSLATYLSDGLRDSGITKVEVVVAKDLDEIATMVNDEKIDVYFGNTANAVIIARQTNALPILRQWKQGMADSYSIFLVKRDGGITDLDQLIGKVISFQAPHSGAGYLLPRAFLREMGFTLRPLETPDSDFDPAEIGFISATGERTSIELLSTGKVEATVVGHAAYLMMPPHLRESMAIISQTDTLPKNLVYVRQGLEARFVDKITEIMTGMHLTEEGRNVLLAMRKTTKFDTIPTHSQRQLEELKILLDLVGPE